MRPPIRPGPLSDLAARLREAGCVFAEDEARLLRGAASGAELERLVSRRVAGEPLEHLLGWVEFCGLRVAVAPGVFVPRRRTELLVELAVSAHPRLVVDLCCGSGAVGAAVAAALPEAEVWATDLDPAAVACARHNLPSDRVVGGDLYDALPHDLRGRVDVLTVNAPYVPTQALPTMPTEARDHEPAAALDGGRDGVEIHRRVAAGARGWLASRGTLLVETSRDLAPATLAAAVAAGLSAGVVTDEDRDATAVVATAP
jgi:release factor glutamine methyltransferase